MKKNSIVCLVLCLIGLIQIGYAWQNCNNGVFIATTTMFDTQTYSILSVGSGNSIIVWQDKQGSYWNIYAQKLNSEGSTLWTAGGVAISTGSNDKYYPIITGDGTGGAIITWFDCRHTNSSDTADIFAQRIDSNGNVLWATNGVAICTAANDQSNPIITSDGVGGAIISWHDKRNGDYDIYAQRVNSTGSTLWIESGIAVCTISNTQWWPAIANDSASGAIISWVDSRNLSSNSTDIYIQRINSEGSTLWAENGIAICTASSEQANPMMICEGLGGVIITWMDQRNGNYDIYAQGVNSSGSILWTNNGITVCTAAYDQQELVLTGDGANGAIIAWEDKRLNSSNFLNNLIYAQRVNSAGSTLWTLNGVAVCTVESQNAPVIVGDNAGGAIIGWYNNGENYLDIYAQRIDGSGNSLWTPDGVAVCIAESFKWVPIITSDGANGAIIAWLDMNGSAPYNIRVQQVDGSGFVPVELSQFEIIN